MAAQQSLKELLIDETAKQLSQPPMLVTDVLRWVFKDVVRAFKIHDEIEISGFGKYLISQNKLKKRIARVEQIKERLEALPQTEDVMNKLSWANKDLQYYYSKLIRADETKQENLLADLGRMAQSGISSGTVERADSGSGHP
jgi:nucleoid DNA-binding protein